MATKQQGRKTTTTAITKWDEELAKEAQVAAEMEKNAGGGQFVSIRGGQMSYNDAPVPGNKLAVVVVSHIILNAFYKGDFDADSPQSPACYAFGTDEATIAPHAEAEEKQSESCKGCPNNEFGSADKGRGKACKNQRRLALLSAGSFTQGGNFEMDDDPEHLQSGAFALINVPVTSVAGWAAIVKQLATTMKLPPLAVAMELAVVPDKKSQFKLTFRLLKKLDQGMVEAVIARREEARAALERPFMARDEEEKAPRSKGRGKKY